MPQYTDNYGLIKPYETENYDIEVQNSNMDKIDLLIKTAEDKINVLDNKLEKHKEDYAQQRQQDQLKIAKVEKELNDYKATMQQVNINQEPKQKATGYGAISLPPNATEGQVSSVGIKGLTATNLAKNGNFANGTDGWSTSNSTLSAKDNTLIVTARNLYRYGQAIQGGNDSIVGHKYYGKAKVRVTNNDCEQLYITIAGIRESVVSPSANQWYTISAHGVATSEGTLIAITQMYETAEIANGKIMELQEVMVIDLTATFGAGNEPTKEECDKIFANWFDGTKSTISAVRIKSVGKNLFDKNNAIKGKYISTGGGIGENPSLALSGYIQIMPNTSYAKSNSYGGWWFDSNKVGISYVAGTSISSPSNAKYFMGNIDNDERLDIFQFEKGDTATPYEPYRESNAYVIAKDEEGNILELRSLPNGTKDEIRVSEGKLIKRVSNWITLDGSESGWSWFDAGGTNERATLNISDAFPNGGVYSPDIYCYLPGESGWNDTKTGLIIDSDQRIRIYRLLNDPSATLQDFRNWLGQNPIRLIYQLAEPIEIPVQVSGTLTSYPNGTVYIEPFVADAGVYANKIEVLHQDLPIKEIEQLSKVDFMTGVEIPLDVSEVGIDENGLSFTHSELEAGDIVFFTYEYDREGTQGETEIEYYDSRYVIKDSVTDKFYKWHIIVADGVPSIELVEV